MGCHLLPVLATQISCARTGLEWSQAARSVQQGWDQQGPGLGTDLPMWLHKLYKGPCPRAKVSWPQLSSPRTFSHCSFHVTQLQGYLAAPLWGLNVGCPIPARRGKVLQSLFLFPGPWHFLRLELFFLVLISPHNCGIRGIFCTVFSQVEKRWFEGELWSEHRVTGTTAIHSK